MYEHPFTLQESIIRVGQVPGLLKHPWFGRRMMDARNFDPTAGNINDKQDKEPRQASLCPSLHRKEITGRDALPVRADEGLP